MLVKDMPSNLENYLKDLRDVEKSLVISKLVNLSDLSREEMEAFKNMWAGINVARRREIVERLVELAEDNFELDYTAIFRLCLGDGDGQVRAKAIDGLSECEERSLLDPLISLLLGDLEDSVRVAAAAALGTFAMLAEFGELKANDADKVEKALLTAFNNKKEQMDVRCRALESISMMSRPQVEVMIRQAYQSDALEFRASALCAMGRTCNSDWLSILLQELGSPSAQLRFEAARACAELEADDAVPRLIELTRDDDAQVRLAAVEALGRIGGNEAKQALQECRDGPDDAMSEAAEDALDEMKFWEDPFAIQS
jgi:HEAT repeat protein